MENIIKTSVIASFDSDGNILPLYFRANNSDSTKVTVKNIRKCADCSLFTCEYMLDDSNEVKTVTLQYNYRSHIWNIVNKLFF